MADRKLAIVIKPVTRCGLFSRLFGLRWIVKVGLLGWTEI